jgi:hypothetical protein
VQRLKSFLFTEIQNGYERLNSQIGPVKLWLALEVNLTAYLIERNRGIPVSISLPALIQKRGKSQFMLAKLSQSAKE